MSRFEQFEVWIFQNNRWELIAAFFDFDTASAVAANRNSRVRLIHAIYENGRVVSSDTLAEIGNIRSA